MRRGHRWGRRAFIASAATGSVTFALVLGYRYVDPLHVLAALLLLPSFLLAVWGKRAPPRAPQADPRNDAAWLRAQWGQLALVALGVGFIVGGITIATVGVTDVFVREDLAYMGVVAPALRAANPHLVPLIAHDRAGFGGALLSDGVAFLLTTLWGLRRGAGWVWWTVLAAGVAGFVPAIGVHLAVGYDNPIHLAPVALGLAIWAAGLGLCRAYCFDLRSTREAAREHAPVANETAASAGAGRGA